MDICGQEVVVATGLVDWPDLAYQSKEDRFYLCANFGRILSGEINSKSFYKKLLELFYTHKIEEWQERSLGVHLEVADGSPERDCGVDGLSLSTRDWNLSTYYVSGLPEVLGTQTSSWSRHSSAEFIMCVSTVFLEIRECGENCF